MEKAYRIRAALASDLESIVALDRKTETLPHWTEADYLAALSPEDRGSGVRGASRCLFVAERGPHEGVVGFAVGKVSRTGAETLGELESVGVEEQTRRTGVGKALCEAVIMWSRSMGAKQIELEVRSRNAGPMALYGRLGFVAVGRRAKYYRDPIDDAILMRVHLASAAVPGAMPGRDL